MLAVEKCIVQERVGKRKFSVAEVLKPQGFRESRRQSGRQQGIPFTLSTYFAIGESGYCSLT